MSWVISLLVPSFRKVLSILTQNDNPTVLFLNNYWFDFIHQSLNQKRHSHTGVWIRRLFLSIHTPSSWSSRSSRKGYQIRFIPIFEIWFLRNYNFDFSPQGFNWKPQSRKGKVDWELLDFDPCIRITATETFQELLVITYHLEFLEVPFLSMSPQWTTLHFTRSIR